METKVDLTSSRRKSLANDLPIWPTLSGSGTRLQSKNGWWSCDSVVGRSDILLCPVTLQKSKPDRGCGCVRDPTADYHGGYWVYPLWYTKLSPYEINHLFVFKVFVVVVCPPVFCSYSAFNDWCLNIPLNIVSPHVCRGPLHWSILPLSPHPACSSLEIDTVLFRNIFRLSTGKRTYSLTQRLLLRMALLHVASNARFPVKMLRPHTFTCRKCTKPEIKSAGLFCFFFIVVLKQASGIKAEKVSECEVIIKHEHTKRTIDPVQICMRANRWKGRLLEAEHRTEPSGSGSGWWRHTDGISATFEGMTALGSSASAPSLQLNGTVPAL